MSKLFKEGITFARYSAAGISAFIFELGLLYVLLRLLEGTSYFSVAIAFVIATVFQYGICHLWVFGSSRRPMRIEYIYFASIMLSGLLWAVGLTALFVDVLGISVIISRAISGIFTGLWDFYLNARFNFRAHAFLRR